MERWGWPGFSPHSSTLNGWQVWPALWALFGPGAEKPQRNRPEKVIHGTLAKDLANLQRLLTGCGWQTREIQQSHLPYPQQLVTTLTSLLPPKGSDSFPPSFFQRLTSQRKWWGTHALSLSLISDLFCLQDPVSSHIHTRFWSFKLEAKATRIYGRFGFINLITVYPKKWVFLCNYTEEFSSFPT